MRPARGAFDAWIFDLDNTLYPADVAVYRDIGARMTAYIAKALDVEEAEALALQKRHFHAYGASVVGLVRHHGFSAADFLADVHDVSLETVAPAPALAAGIAALPGRRFVFTNGARGYALRVLERLGLSPHIEGVSAIDDRGLLAKPDAAAFRAMFEAFAVDPARAVVFDDHPENARQAEALGATGALVGAREAPPGISFAAPALIDLLEGAPFDCPVRL